MSRMLPMLENWNRYTDHRERLDAENALFPYPVQGASSPQVRAPQADRTPAKSQPKGWDRFGDGFEASSTRRASLSGTSSTSAAQFRKDYLSDGFSAASAPRMSLGNDNASLTFGAAAAPQDTSFTPTLADVELMLAGEQ